MNLVTIDFDIIMAPSIESYNNQVSTSRPIEKIKEDFPFLPEFPADLYIYEYLTRYILSVAKQNKKIYFIDDHSEVVQFFETPPYSLYNIDHHHDIGYNWGASRDCGNWVRFLWKEGKITSYTWINDENSQKAPKRIQKYLTEEKNIRETNLELLAPETDVLVLCASYEWVPPLYHPLFLAWKTMIEFI
jgi:hypothetical protein